MNNVSRGLRWYWEKTERRDRDLKAVLTLGRICVLTSATNPTTVIYRLLELKIEGKTTSYAGGAVLIIPASAARADLRVINKDGYYSLFAPFGPTAKKIISEIVYELSVWSDKAFSSRLFRHPGEGKLMLRASALEAKSGELFKADTVNATMKTKHFPGVNRLEFVA